MNVFSNSMLQGIHITFVGGAEKIPISTWKKFWTQLVSWFSWECRYMALSAHFSLTNWKQMQQPVHKRKTKTLSVDRVIKEMLLEKIIPEINAIFPPEIREQFFYQLDGAPGHTSSLVVKCLNKYFPNRWLGNKGPLNWAPRSPDLTPLGSYAFLWLILIFFFVDFSFWGVLRDNVYRRRPDTIQNLKEAIMDEVAKMPEKYYENICLGAVHARLVECRKSSGQLIEPFIA